jgi:hypothetical protein
MNPEQFTRVEHLSAFQTMFVSNPLLLRKFLGTVANAVPCDLFTASVGYTWKLFMSIAGFGIRPRNFSLYFQSLPETGSAPIATIISLSSLLTPLELDRGARYAPYFFSGKIRFLSRKEVLPLLSSESLGYFQRQSPIPTPLLQKLVFVDEAHSVNVRQLKFKKGAGICRT